MLDLKTDIPVITDVVYYNMGLKFLIIFFPLLCQKCKNSISEHPKRSKTFGFWRAETRSVSSESAVKENAHQTPHFSMGIEHFRGFL